MPTPRPRQLQIRQWSSSFFGPQRLDHRTLGFRTLCPVATNRSLALLQITRQRPSKFLKLGEPRLEFSQLRSQEIAHLPASLQAALILRGDKIADLLQREAECLRLLDESKALESLWRYTRKPPLVRAGVGRRPTRS
jgi:hypothetical protein